MEGPEIPKAQIVYGNIIYWLSIVAAIICMIGPVIGMLFIDSNILNPHYLFATIWEGKNSDAIWQEAGRGFPGGHFWLGNITTGDGITQLGLVIGCGCALPALIAAAVIYLSREKSFGWALLALWIAALITVSAIGIFSLK